MLSSNDSTFFFLVILFVATILSPLANGQGLKVGFYEKTCPNAEAITGKVIGQVMSVAPSLSGPLLRMHFHDCFIRGCDGSILLDSPKNDTEKYSPPNLSLRGFQIIDKVKVALEKECPGVVSCADILAIVARDVSVATKAHFWEVETGRRDGKVSKLADALNLPPPFANISSLKSDFLQRGLNTKDLVVLSGGHTLGTSHCSSFNNRLYNFTGKGNIGDSDPTLDSEYAKRLAMKCKPGDQTTLVELDPGSFKTFDVNYFTLVGKRRGLLQSDAALLDDKETKAYVEKAAAGGSSFFKDFGVSMVKMGRIGVLTGKSGEIRKVCSMVN
ncbi:peroxidase 27-like [Impatiens glandulifera]|uniref:peroxidase 27-like n=1 Tax=Impatiens glandulifera TaxID=253017 RepID=UPI001FB0D6C8|nr:peroxidase 27-like [Impatiens glandulifera]